MKISNGTVFCDDMALRKTDIYTDGDRIVESGCCCESLDASGCIVAPGFIDIHIHGAVGHDFCEASREANDVIARYLSSVGVTSYMGTTMAMPREVLLAVLSCGKEVISSPTEGGAAMRGVNLEGPFIAKSKMGAMFKDYIRDPDFELFSELFEASGKNIKLCEVPPELPGGIDFIKKASQMCTVSIAHSSADYATAVEAYKNGAKHLTHLFNAMTPFSHREPGIVGAAMDYAEHTELISDGVHVHPSAIRVAFAIMGNDKICLISDAMMACGMPNGQYSLGGQSVNVQDGCATLANGTIAGSATPLTECFRRAVKLFGIPLISALKAATVNPAKATGIFDEVGSVTVGKRADFTLLDETTLEVKHCVIGGKLIF